MNVRTTHVEWDPTLIRIEYLDDRGRPYYCVLEPKDARLAFEAQQSAELVGAIHCSRDLCPYPASHLFECSVSQEIFQLLLHFRGLEVPAACVCPCSDALG